MESKNLYQKLHLIQTKVNGLGKDSQSFGYKFVSGSKVLTEIKPLMNELGLILKQEVLSIENERMDYKTKSGEKSEILSKVMMRFTWIDVISGEKDENSFGANGQNDWEKGLGSALTYAERYFLLKFFHIATDEDDIDNSDRKPIEKEVEKVIELKPEQKQNDKNLAEAKTVELLGTIYLALSKPEKDRVNEEVLKLKAKLISK
jgi:hypothetical protein